jgi:Tfp pilus assembly protein PilX
MSSQTKAKGFAFAADRRGFALITAILAIMILMALGLLALSTTSEDLKISSRVVGEKKALAAAENGIHVLMQNFDPANMAVAQATNVQVDSTADPSSRYTISSVGRPSSGPEMLALRGY